ncbi:hypothetical protein MRBLRH13_000243 [Agrobacterium radiobacter]|uniref:hypothetical protein n=1 Tax=Agrobacterium radiobacter TaxID=362 RepID=UPI00344242C1
MTTTEQEREQRLTIHLLINGKAELIHDEEAGRLNEVVRHCRINHVRLKANS